MSRDALWVVLQKTYGVPDSTECFTRDTEQRNSPEVVTLIMSTLLMQRDGQLPHLVLWHTLSERHMWVASWVNHCTTISSPSFSNSAVIMSTPGTLFRPLFWNGVKYTLHNLCRDMRVLSRNVLKGGKMSSKFSCIHFD